MVIVSEVRNSEVRNSEVSVAELGARIRVARKSEGIIQTELADLAGTSERTIRAIESGTGNPSLRAAAQAHRYCRCLQGGVLAGQLRRTADGGVEFANSAEHLAEPQQQVTFSLPLSKEPVLSGN